MQGSYSSNYDYCCLLQVLQMGSEKIILIITILQGNRNAVHLYRFSAQ